MGEVFVNEFVEVVWKIVVNSILLEGIRIYVIGLVVLFVD